MKNMIRMNPFCIIMKSERGAQYESSESLGKVWDKVFKNGSSETRERSGMIRPYPNADHTPSNCLKAIFHKFYLIHFWILCPKRTWMWGLREWTYLSRKIYPRMYPIVWFFLKLLFWKIFPRNFLSICNTQIPLGTNYFRGYQRF